jgi:hypothetical protein
MVSPVTVTTCYQVDGPFNPGINAPGQFWAQISAEASHRVRVSGQRLVGHRSAALERSERRHLPGLKRVKARRGRAVVTIPHPVHDTWQNQCPSDPVGHIGMFEDSPSLQDVLNQLGPDSPSFKPTCTNEGEGL